MILKHRDRELLRFEWTGARGVRVLSVNEAERKFLPIDMSGSRKTGYWQVNDRAGGAV